MVTSFPLRPETRGTIFSVGSGGRVIPDTKGELLISDPQGRPRIRIGVDKWSEPSIVMLSPAPRTRACPNAPVATCMTK
jgi:hypothetical protein